MVRAFLSPRRSTPSDEQATLACEPLRASRAPVVVVGLRRIDRVSRRLLLVPVVTVLVTTVLFYGAHRIRSPLEPTVVVGAAVAIAAWWAMRRRTRSRAGADAVGEGTHRW
jgi:hypothetical protein